VKKPVANNPAKSISAVARDRFPSGWRTGSGAEEDLNGLPRVHRLVTGRCLVQRELDVEHLAGVDLPVPDQVDELGQEPADRGGAAVQIDAGEEQVRDGKFGVCAEPPGQFLDFCYSLVAALPDDVGGAELPGQLLPRFMAAHRDNPLGAELVGRQHAEQPHGTVPDHRDGLPGSGLGGNRGKPPGSQHV